MTHGEAGFTYPGGRVDIISEDVEAPDDEALVAIYRSMRKRLAEVDYDLNFYVGKFNVRILPEHDNDREASLRAAATELYDHLKAGGTLVTPS